MWKLRCIAVLLIFMVSAYIVYWRVDFYNKLIPVKATVKIKSKSTNNRNSVKLNIETKEYNRIFKLSYVLFSSKIEDDMYVRANEHITAYIRPVDQAKLNTFTQPRNTVVKPTNNLEVYGVIAGQTWRSYTLKYDLLVDVVIILLYTFMASLIPLIANNKDLEKEWIGNTMSLIMFSLMITVYLLERFY
jgi:hypothetical protein